MTGDLRPFSLCLISAFVLLGCDDSGNQKADPCLGITCSGNGVCVVQYDAAVCSCYFGYHPEGLNCVRDPDPCDDVTCSGHGTCVDDGGGGVSCDCDEGYVAQQLRCLSETSACLGELCSGHGTCVEDGEGVASCDCDEGYVAVEMDCISETSDPEICNNLVDDDDDGRPDCLDPDCSTSIYCLNEEEICDNDTDDDGDGDVDCHDVDCDGDIACFEAENCENGIDDDGDGATDCDDSDCADAAACQAAGCTLDTLFYDSPATCDVGFQCSVNETYAATCQPDAMFAGGDFYGACGGNGECPFGSICAGSSQLDASCMPFCQAETHPECPAGGSCIYSLSNSTLNLCGSTDGL